MIPQAYLVPFIATNAVALVLIAMALLRPAWARYAFALIFAGAAAFNAFTAIRDPQVYLAYADLAAWGPYRTFIDGAFATHTAAFVLAIAAGQLAVAVLLMLPAAWRALGAFGGVVFLLAITPLGMGSAFPATLVLALGLVLALAAESRRIPERPLGRARRRARI